MSLLVQNIRLSLDADENEAIILARKIARLPQSAKGVIAGRSVDARHGRPTLVFSVAFMNLEDEVELSRLSGDPNVTIRSKTALDLTPGLEKMRGRPVVCGFGPAGMFCALILARYGYRPIVLERGDDVDSRAKKVSRLWKEGILDASSNVQFGEGGAGTFSDGKLTTRINDPLCALVLETLCQHGAPWEILAMARPHIGTDKLRVVVKSIRNEIVALGGEIRFLTRMTGVKGQNGRILSVATDAGGEIETQALILAIGHSARDTYEMLFYRGIAMEQKPFSIGVRAEHLREDIDSSMYGKWAGHKNLPPAEYRLSYKSGGRACYTFCMCPGGVVVCAASEEGGLAINGMSYFSRSLKNSNSAVVVSVDRGDFDSIHPLAGVEFQRKWERLAFLAGGSDYGAPIETLSSFMGQGADSFGRVIPSYTGKYREAALKDCLPPYVWDMLKLGFKQFGRKIFCFDRADTMLTGVETRTSAPLRIIREENRQSPSLLGLYPCGEGAGYAGGIMSAAVDGIKTALSVIEAFAP